MHGTLAAFALLLASAVLTFGQTTLQFTAIAQTDEQAIRLAWTSQSLLGTETLFTGYPLIAENWADFMLGDPAKAQAPQTIEAAWSAAFRRAYTNNYAVKINPTKVSVAGDSACFGDYLQNRTNTVLSGSWIIHDAVQVYP
jgi:hypothetical protein